MSTSQPGAAKRSIRPVAAILLGLAGLELLLRALLFVDVGPLPTWGAPLRHAGHYTPGPKDEEYWKLRAVFQPERARRVLAGHDPRIGWIQVRVQPGVYRHIQESRLPGRRPVLFYGDSFAACTTTPDACWEDLLERTELGAELLMLNYGAGGYGLDQIYLLFAASVGNYADLDPIVVVGVLLDEDLDRAFLGLRGAPKPRLAIEDGALVGAEVPRESAQDYVARNPVGIASYLWRFVKYGSGLVTHGPQDLPAKRELNRRILEEIVSVARSRELELFFVLFHGPQLVATPERPRWQERLVRETLDELEVPYVSSLDALRADSQRTGKPLPEYFRLGDQLIHHYPPETIEVIFPSILERLRQVHEAAGD